MEHQLVSGLPASIFELSFFAHPGGPTHHFCPLHVHVGNSFMLGFLVTEKGDIWVENARNLSINFKTGHFLCLGPEN